MWGPGVDDPKTVKKAVRELADVAYIDARIGQNQVADWLGGEKTEIIEMQNFEYLHDFDQNSIKRDLSVPKTYLNSH